MSQSCRLGMSHSPVRCGVVGGGHGLGVDERGRAATGRGADLGGEWASDRDGGGRSARSQSAAGSPPARPPPRRRRSRLAHRRAARPTRFDDLSRVGTQSLRRRRAGGRHRLFRRRGQRLREGTSCSQRQTPAGPRSRGFRRRSPAGGLVSRADRRSPAAPIVRAEALPRDHPSPRLWPGRTLRRALPPVADRTAKASSPRRPQAARSLRARGGHHRRSSRNHRSENGFRPLGGRSRGVRGRSSARPISPRWSNARAAICCSPATPVGIRPA